MSKWQYFEKRVAAYFNTVRTPFSGSNSGITSSDSLSDNYYLECKQHKDTSILKLMKETIEKAKKENKIPVLALGEPDTGAKDVFLMFHIKDIFKIMRGLDLSEMDKRYPDGTTIEKLIQTSSSENRSLFEIKEQLTIEVKRIMREKIISGDALEDIKTLGALLYMIDTIMDYSKDDDGDEND